MVRYGSSHQHCLFTEFKWMKNSFISPGISLIILFVKNAKICRLFFIMTLLVACGKEPDPFYRDSMRDLVIEISTYSRTINLDFIVIPQNGIELISSDGTAGASLEMDYINAIDGVGQEDLFYGYTRDDRETPENETEYLLEFLDRLTGTGRNALVTDYCSSSEHKSRSVELNDEHGFISFQAEDRELGIIPTNTPNNENQEGVKSLAETRNFLYLINPEKFDSRTDLVEKLSATTYDLFIFDLFFENDFLTSTDIQLLKKKPGGAERLVIAYMSIGEAEDYRYYWDPAWDDNPPSWLRKENPDWEGNYKVAYWESDWQTILLGTTESYLDRIIAAGFDGVYLDLIEAFEYFE